MTGSIEQGTGFMLKGYGLITCSHVISHPKLHAYRANETTRHYPVEVIAQDRDIDLAILKIVAPMTDALERETAKEPRNDDDLILAGYPSFAPGHTGIIDRCRIIGSHAHYSPPRLFINRAVIYGNSGGPILNMDLRVVGVAVTGAASEIEATATERHGIIPISALDSINQSKPQAGP